MGDLPHVCCHIGCFKAAEFTIHAIRPFGETAGPDHYADDTLACKEHVGQLLGHQLEAKDADEIYWAVFRLDYPFDVRQKIQSSKEAAPVQEDRPHQTKSFV